MANCVRNVDTKNYQNLTIGFQVTIKNVGNVFFETQCMYEYIFVYCTQLTNSNWTYRKRN